MKIKLILLILVLFLLGGCTAKEPESRFTVTALGFAKDDQAYHVYLQTADPEKGAFTLNGEGNSFSSALLAINTKLTREPSFSHCEVLVFSKGAQGEELEAIFRLVNEKGVPLRSKILFCEKPDKLFKAGEGGDGYDLASLVLRTAENFGFGGHTAVFEIETALLVNDRDFALVNVDANKELQITGLRRYRKGQISENLDIKESIQYAKDNKTFKGGE